MSMDCDIWKNGKVFIGYKREESYKKVQLKI